MKYAFSKYVCTLSSTKKLRKCFDDSYQNHMFNGPSCLFIIKLIHYMLYCLWYIYCLHNTIFAYNYVYKQIWF